MEYKINYLSDKKPRIDVFIGEVTDGVYLICCELYERLVHDAIGSDGEWDIIYFTDGYESIIEVCFKPPSVGILIGELSKKTYLGTFYEDRVFNKIMDNILNND